MPKTVCNLSFKMLIVFEYIFFINTLYYSAWQVFFSPQKRFKCDEQGWGASSYVWLVSQLVSHTFGVFIKKVGYVLKLSYELQIIGYCIIFHTF